MIYPNHLHSFQQIAKFHRFLCGVIMFKLHESTCGLANVESVDEMMSYIKRDWIARAKNPHDGDVSEGTEDLLNSIYGCMFGGKIERKDGSRNDDLGAIWESSFDSMDSSFVGIQLEFLWAFFHGEPDGMVVSGELLDASKACDEFEADAAIPTLLDVFEKEVVVGKIGVWEVKFNLLCNLLTNI